MATRDFRSQQIRTTQIIASGSDTTSKPSLLIYSASAASNDQGSVTAGLLTDVGSYLEAMLQSVEALAALLLRVFLVEI